jgi:hypothetical protein
MSVPPLLHQRFPLVQIDELEHARLIVIGHPAVGIHRQADDLMALVEGHVFRVLDLAVEVVSQQILEVLAGGELVTLGDQADIA